MTASATLSAHTNSDVVTRAQLEALPAVIGTDTFKPVAHIELVQQLDKVLESKGIITTREELALRRDGKMLFGVRKVFRPSGSFNNNATGLITDDGTAALGFRTANDKTMSIQLIAGLSVFVCDNLVFRGDLIALKRKHTSGLELTPELDGAIDRFLQHYSTLTGEIENLKAKHLEDVRAKAMIHDAFIRGIMPTRFFPEVSENYFRPPHEEFAGRNAWSLHNAFTEVAKQMPVTTRFNATKEIGEFFGMVGGNA